MNRRRSQQKRSQRQQRKRQQRKTQRRNKQRQQQQQQQGQQQNGGMTGVLNTALVPFGLLALQKHQQKRVAERKLADVVAKVEKKN